MSDVRRRTTDVLDAPDSDRSPLIEVEPARVPASQSPRRAVTTFLTNRLSSLVLVQEGPQTRSFPIGWVTFVAFVAVPAIMVLLYFVFVASNQYVAEMRLVVRMGRAQGGGFSGLMGQMSGGGSSAVGAGASSISPGASFGSGGGGMSTEAGTSVENAHIVTSYIHSRAIVDELVKVVNLREIFSRPGADFYARLSPSATVEDLTDYWRSMVKVSLDSLSGIVTVQVRAFRPEDAVEISRHVETLSERLVNTISARARADTVRRATEEVERAQGVLLTSLQAMEAFRNREGLIDPIETAKQTGKLLAKVLGEQLEAENQLFIAMKSLAPDSATVRTLKTRADNLRKQVAEIRAQLAGSDGQSSNVAGTLARYEEVAIQQKLAQTLYSIAENGLERARIAAEAQSVYLSVFVKPGIPEGSTYPKRIEFTLLLIGMFLVAWSICALVWASVLDHRLG